MPLKEHPHFQTPADPSAFLWRYVDLPKFLSMLSSGTVFFARADLLGDPFEGSWPRPNVEGREFRYKAILPPDADAVDVAKAKSNFTKKWREVTFVSCWHLSPYESVAMWQLYTARNAGGIAADDSKSTGGTCQFTVDETVDTQAWIPAEAGGTRRKGRPESRRPFTYQD